MSSNEVSALGYNIEPEFVSSTFTLSK